MRRRGVPGEGWPLEGEPDRLTGQIGGGGSAAGAAGEGG